MRIVLLDTLTFGETSLEGFNELGEVEVFQTTSRDQTLERVKNADVIVTNKVVIDDAIMSESKNLKLICVAATGTNNIDHDSALKHNVEVKNVAGYSSDSVIQHTFSMLFYLLGYSRYYDEVVKSGAYSRSPIFTDVSKPFFELKGKKYGVIGLGEIGRGVATIAKAFGAEVLYYSTSGKNRTDDFQRADLSDLLRECDVISIHSPLNDKTKNLINQENLKLLKANAIILNLGRGGIINEEDLAIALDSQELYAGLDVLEREPMREDHPFLKVKNSDKLYITPHIAWTSIEARDKLIAGVINNIKEFKNKVN
ncbi:MAG: D-2-hydroxyacid dehydrogenase [Helicobacteraceae bacterium]|nr:D-2-hydroxyacid dehydrogenase [Helicobacteraceae bacterium]